MTQPSNLKVKRLVELDQLPPEAYDDAQMYAVHDSKDYKLNVDILVDAAAGEVVEEVLAQLPPVASSGSYNDLIDKPFIPDSLDDLSGNSDSITQGPTQLFMTGAERTKLAGIASGAQVNTVTSVNGETGAVSLDAADVGAEAAFSKGSLIQGSGVVLTGTLGDRLVGAGDVTISATGGGGGGAVNSVEAGTGIAVDDTDPSQPVVSLSMSAIGSLAAADTAVQGLSDLGISATATELNYTSGATSNIQAQLNAIPGALSSSTSNTITGGQVQRAALTGDVTAPANNNVTTIANDAVTNAKLANVNTSTIKGRVTAGSGDPEDLTAAQVRTLLNVADGAQVNVATNLALGTITTTTIPVTNSNGTGLTIPAATTSLAGLLTSTDKTKLNGIAASATVGATWGTNLNSIPANITSWAGIAPASKADTTALASYLPLAGGTMTGGQLFGSATAPGDVATNLSRHISLYSTNHGFSVTTNRMNYIVPSGAAHAFLVNGVNKLSVDASGIIVPGAVSSTGAAGGILWESRSGGTTYGWYGQSGTIRLNVSGVGDVVSINHQGDIEARDLTAARGGGQGVVFLGGTTRYLYYDGTKYEMPGAALHSPGVVLGGGSALTKITCSSSAPGTLQAGELYLRF